MGKLVGIFQQRTESLKVIFSSYSSLHDVYGAVLASADIPKGKMDMYNKTKRSAESKQAELSESLHTQAFILAAGSFEALLKDLLEDLILENFTKMNTIGGIQFTLHEMKQIIQRSEQEDFVSIKLAESVIRQLFNNKNAHEKINFQNTQSMKDVFRKLFSINISEKNEELLNRLHIIWQKRHALVHSDGRVDKRYINNVKQVGRVDEHEGDRIVITKDIYHSAKRDFEELLNALENSVIEKGLSIEGLG